MANKLMLLVFAFLAFVLLATSPVLASPADASSESNTVHLVKRNRSNGKWNPKDFFASANNCVDQSGWFDVLRGDGKNEDFRDCACFYNNWQARDRMKDCLMGRHGYGTWEFRSSWRGYCTCWRW
ncbi:hypothetical protein HDU96_010233 [Phlyctochytrium bullatum]|nr:hypothetical protein HDU96_010233 [Phlyctochytrium bullatum]